MEITNSEFYKKLSDYQKQIINHLKNGAILQSNEGVNYKTWLKFPDGSIKNIRRNSVELITGEDSYQFLSFGNEGIKLKSE